MLFDYIDGYCERTAPGLWAEPLNAMTNLAFFVAAIMLTHALLRAGRSVRRDWGSLALVGLVYVIGTGSTLFHTLALGWAMLADVIPIGLFILLYTYLALTRFAGAGVAVGLAGVAVVLALAFGLPVVLPMLPDGSYPAALSAMLGIGLWLRLGLRHPAGNALLLAAAVFAVSLTLRTLDLPLCSEIPAGTHFLWHLLNACVLYIVARAMLRYGRPGSAG